MDELQRALEAHRLFVASGGQSGAMFGSVHPAVSEMPTRGTSALAGMDLWDVSLSEADLTGADLTGFSIDHGWMNAVNGRGATARGIFAKKTELHNANFAGADLTGAQLITCEAWRTNFADATLNEARIVDVSFSEADLSRAWVRNATFIAVSFPATNLTDTDFTGTTGTVFATAETHPSWNGLDLVDALRARGADVTYVEQ